MPRFRRHSSQRSTSASAPASMPNGARAVALAVQDADRAAGEVDVRRLERERLPEAEAAPPEAGDERPVADARRSALRAGGEQALDLGPRQGLRREPATLRGRPIGALGTPNLAVNVCPHTATRFRG